MRLPEHGANPQYLYTELGIAAPPHVLDFSENVNPAGPPQSVINLWPELVGKLTAYPDPMGEPFRSAAADFHGVGSENVFAGNGAAELLALLAERYRGKQAIIVHPTFSEYEATLRAKDAEIIQIVASELNGFQLPVNAILHAMETADVLYICTPNNPTGILPAREDLRQLILHGKTVGCEIVLDEAFIDFVDESRSFISELAENPHLFIIRSMTKMYAIPGIRLGYAVANSSVIDELKACAPHWNVNGIAAAIGTVCFKEEVYRQRAVDHSNSEREKMKRFLLENKCTVTDSQANFLTFKPKDGQSAANLHIDLLKRGIVLRHSRNFRGMDGHWLRIGMKNETDMTVLKEELTQWFAEN